ncbi:MAG: NADH-quinone oxidoreductase subunit NuoG [Gammaproteobacteria bacterium]|nr:NADH-quinone oxidoreductase subunit NuoG [Gammaproteobacteria bacterium]
MSDSITLTINGQQVEAQAGQLLIDVADDNNIVVPRFCYHKKLSVAANCRMCLVEIERSPKPMPACATHVVDGMVVQTRSAAAIAAQKSTMEFLLINHPLDCPICDQGGECELQDVAMGFGEGVSKYTEQKRVVMDKNIGPLIATDFTRCIHCTRCIRFGDEIAGLPEMGATGRGEHVEIGTYIEKSISSELSGNVIDVCPVGALTAKPSRYTARPWELTQQASVSAHDCIGTNTYVHSRGNEVIRVVPRENEAINESWISDRDRFSYTAVKSENRVLEPMMRVNGQLKAVDWETAIQVATDKLSAAANQDAEKIAMLISPQSTLEEHFLAQKLVRGLGSNNIDHRLTQVDFSAQDKDAIMPWLGRSLASIESLNAALVVGGNLRLEQPILSHRLRKAAINHGAAVASVSHLAGQYNFPLAEDLAGSVEQLVNDLAAVAAAAVGLSKIDISARMSSLLEKSKPESAHKAIAKSLIDGESSAIIVGIQAVSSARLTLIQELCEAIAASTASTLGYLSPSANSAGACLAGCLPHRSAAGVVVSKAGQHTRQISRSAHSVLVNFGVNPVLDFGDGIVAGDLAANNDFVISINSFANDFDQNNADLVLPLACTPETSGTFVNVEGLWQGFKGCVNARGQSRPGWKILSALGQLLLPGEFDYEDSGVVKKEVKLLCHDVSLSNQNGIQSSESCLPSRSRSLQRIGFFAIYASDEMSRLSTALQATPLMDQQSAATMSREQAEQLKLTDAEQIHIKQGQGTAVLPLRINDNVPMGCVSIPCGIDAVKNLPGAFGEVELEKVS